jgi:hypothetical protein
MTPQEIQDWLFRHEATVTYGHTGEGVRLVRLKVSGAHPATARTLRDAVVALSYSVGGLRRPVKEPG